MNKEQSLAHLEIEKVKKEFEDQTNELLTIKKKDKMQNF
jgi:hypothetical protein